MQKSMPQIVASAIQKLHDTPESEWPAIYDTLNKWEWDSQLGEKPSDWDSMKHYKNKRFLCFPTGRNDKKARTRYNIITPINQHIVATLGEKAVMRYHHMHNLGRTERQFEDWWDSQSYRVY